MISLKLNSGELDKFYHQINLKVEGLEAFMDPQVLTQLNDAIFTISSRRFVRALNIAARVDPKSFHHIYEWNRTGDNKKRLYFIRKEYSMGSSLRIGAGFLQSKTPVPIPTALLEPGTTGKSVVSRNVFRDKAEVMESGIGISYQANKTLAFLNRSGVIGFIPAGKIINILNPGGVRVKGSFEKFFHAWYAVNTAVVIQSSGVMQSLQDAIVQALNEKNAGLQQSKEAAISTLKAYASSQETE